MGALRGLITVLRASIEAAELALLNQVTLLL